MNGWTEGTVRLLMHELILNIPSRNGTQKRSRIDVTTPMKYGEWRKLQILLEDQPSQYWAPTTDEEDRAPRDILSATVKWKRVSCWGRLSGEIFRVPFWIGLGVETIGSSLLFVSVLARSMCSPSYFPLPLPPILQFSNSNTIILIQIRFTCLSYKMINTT